MLIIARLSPAAERHFWLRSNFVKLIYCCWFFFLARIHFNNQTLNKFEKYFIPHQFMRDCPELCGSWNIFSQSSWAFDSALYLPTLSRRTVIFLIKFTLNQNNKWTLTYLQARLCSFLGKLAKMKEKKTQPLYQSLNFSSNHCIIIV